MNTWIERSKKSVSYHLAINDSNKVGNGWRIVLRQSAQSIVKRNDVIKNLLLIEMDYDAKFESEFFADKLYTNQGNDHAALISVFKANTLISLEVLPTFEYLNLFTGRGKMHLSIISDYVANIKSDYIK